MSYLILTKHCGKCNQEKVLTDFYKNRAQPSGLSSWCKVCILARGREPEVLERQRIRQQTPESKEWHLRYAKTDKVKARRKKYNRNRSIEYPEKIKALSAVNNAIRKGLLPRPDSFMCTCGDVAKEYHHYLGHDKEHYFDVVPMCCICHRRIDAQSRHGTTKSSNLQNRY